MPEAILRSCEVSHEGTTQKIFYKMFVSIPLLIPHDDLRNLWRATEDFVK